MFHRIDRQNKKAITSPGPGSTINWDRIKMISLVDGWRTEKDKDVERHEAIVKRDLKQDK